jgi:hypothetical protein
VAVRDIGCCCFDRDPAPELAKPRSASDGTAARRRPHRWVQRPFSERGLLGLVPKYLPALWSGRNQILPDRVAGIVVVVERGR